MSSNLTAPSHIKGSLRDSLTPGAKALREQRDEWIAAVAMAGHSKREIAEALGLSCHTACRLVRCARQRGNLAPASAPVIVTPKPATGITLHRAPWEAETGHDPRHETTPRFSLVRPAPQSSRIDAVIAAIRAEAGRAQA